MNDNKFWTTIWFFVTIVIVSLVWSINIYYIDVNMKILTAIQHGADPIKATCAFDFGSTNAKVGICTSVASK